jgi:hypothetical protein
MLKLSYSYVKIINLVSKGLCMKRLKLSIHDKILLIASIIMLIYVLGNYIFTKVL